MVFKNYRALLEPGICFEGLYQVRNFISSHPLNFGSLHTTRGLVLVRQDGFRFNLAGIGGNIRPVF